MNHLQIYEKAKGEEITAKMVIKELKKKYSDTDATEVFSKDNDEYDILRIVGAIREHYQNNWLCACFLRFDPFFRKKIAV